MVLCCYLGEQKDQNSEWICRKETLAEENLAGKKIHGSNVSAHDHEGQRRAGGIRGAPGAYRINTEEPFNNAAYQLSPRPASRPPRQKFANTTEKKLQLSLQIGALAVHKPLIAIMLLLYQLHPTLEGTTALGRVTLLGACSSGSLSVWGSPC